MPQGFPGDLEPHQRLSGFRRAYRAPTFDEVSRRIRPRPKVEGKTGAQEASGDDSPALQGQLGIASQEEGADLGAAGQRSPTRGDQDRNSEAPGQFTASGPLRILSFGGPAFGLPQAAFNFRLSGRSAHDAMITAPITTGVTM